MSVKRLFNEKSFHRHNFEETMMHPTLNMMAAVVEVVVVVCGCGGCDSDGGGGTGGCGGGGDEGGGGGGDEGGSGGGSGGCGRYLDGIYVFLAHMR